MTMNVKLKIIVTEEGQKNTTEIQDWLYWFEENGVMELGKWDDERKGYVCEGLYKKFLIRFETITTHVSEESCPTN